MEEVKLTKSQRTRKLVLEAAMELMKEHGYYGTTIRDICAAAGVSVGTFYTYFPSKQDVFSDIFGAADKLFTETVAGELKGDTVCEKIVDYFNYYAQLNLDSSIEVMKVIYNSENTWFVNPRPMHYVLIDLLAEGQENGELVSDIEPQDMMFFLYTLARGCCYNWCIRDGNYDLKAQMEDFITRALKSYQPAA